MRVRVGMNKLTTDGIEIGGVAGPVDPENAKSFSTKKAIQMQELYSVEMGQEIGE